jgi:hypothetical protein
MRKPTLLIVTGPQGSGNHLFSKILSKHPDVYGWSMKTYWEGHHLEPFNYYWKHPDRLSDFSWTDYEYIFTSVSCPYFRDGGPQIPKYKEFITTAQKFSNVKVAIIGRDQNVLMHQQSRVRGNVTTDIFKENLEQLMQYNPLFVSQELYQLYGNRYLQSISSALDFPIEDQPICSDANAKYFKPVKPQLLDKEIKKACQNC